MAERHQIMRGVALHLSPQLREHVHRLLDTPLLEESERGKEFGLGPMILDEISQRPNRHWTGSKRGIAEIASGARAGGHHLPVILHGEYEGPRAPNEGLHDEDEHTLGPEHIVRINGIEVKDRHSRTGWRHVLREPRTEPRTLNPGERG